jgi:hypothetical protein
MKKLLIPLVLMATIACAQPPPDGTVPDATAWEDAVPPPPPDLPPPGDGPGAPPGDVRGKHPPLQRFLEVLSEQNPEEFDRLKKLRDEDPEAFRKELHQRLQKERERRGLPGGRGLEQPSPEERGRLGRHQQTGGPGPEGMNVRSPETDRLEQKSRDLAQAYRLSTDEAEKARLQAELKTNLAESFDLREKMRRERFAQMENRIKKVRELMEQRQAQREEIINRRLKELTEGEKLAW